MNDLIFQQNIILLCSALKEVLELHKRTKKYHFLHFLNEICRHKVITTKNNLIVKLCILQNHFVDVIVCHYYILGIKINIFTTYFLGSYYLVYHTWGSN